MADQLHELAGPGCCARYCLGSRGGRGKVIGDRRRAGLRFEIEEELH